MHDPLEERARYYARKAVLADKNGRYDEALKNYRKAIELFRHLVKLRPDSAFTSFYVELLKKYTDRVKVLEKLAQGEIIGPPRRGPSGEQGSEEIEFEIYPPDSPGRPKITFNDVVGLYEVKKALKRSVVYPVRRPELFPLGWPRGILLFGPPGCGKTYIVAALANEVNAYLFKVSAANIMSKWLGEAEKNVAKLFKKAREIASGGEPVIIFIDEVDGLLRVYNEEIGGEARVKNQFLMEMDGLQDKDNKLLLFVIGTTNKPWLLDLGFVRRFQKRIYVPPPDLETRRELFKYYINKAMKGPIKIGSDVDIDRLARLTEGYSSHDIENIVMETLLEVVDEHFESTGGKGEPREIRMEDFVRTIKRVRPSINPKHISTYMEWSERYASI